MEIRAEQALEAIARASMEKCAAKLSRISSGKWRLVGVGVRRRTMAEIVESYPLESEGGAGVFLEVGGAEPFSSMVVFRPEDLEVISRGFLGYSFSKLPVLNQAQELLLSEVGNILLNFFISAMSNALGRGVSCLRRRNAYRAGHGSCSRPCGLRSTQENPTAWR